MSPSGLRTLCWSEQLARVSNARPSPHPESSEAPHLRHVVLLRAQVLLLLHEELLLLAPPGRA